MKYRTIVADPPWDYPEGFVSQTRTPSRNWKGPTIRHPLPYPSMTLREIADLPVGDLADRNARLFLWATNRYLPDAFGIARSWGFDYRQTLVWKKLDGLTGSIAPNAEFLIVATQGTPGRRGRIANAVIEHSQSKTHSRKPDLFLDLVEQVSPGPYLEMFSRRTRLGWDSWGNEALGHVELVG